MPATKPPALTDRIRCRTAEITVWGAGFIGISAAAALLSQGFSCAIVDVDPAKVELLRKGILPLAGFDDRVSLDTEALSNGRLRILTAPDARTSAAPIHVVCVNTERGGKPFSRALESVLRSIGEASESRGEALIVIESTVNPAWLNDAEDLLGIRSEPEQTPVHLATAPRRDWLLSSDKNLRSLPRVIGTSRPESVEPVLALYNTISDNIEIAPDWRHAALVKPVENLFRFVDLVLTNQLAIAYPGLDMAEVLRLAGTKWNMNTHHPSIGLGGYCIPIAPHYVGEGLFERGLLPLAHAAVNWDQLYPDLVAEQLLAVCPGPIGVLGVSYAPDVRVPQGSPGLTLAARLLEHNAHVYVHDPYFLKDELASMTDADQLQYPEDLAYLGTVIVATAHSAYADLPSRLCAMATPPVVVDSLGTMRDAFTETKVRYLEIGAPLEAAASESAEPAVRA